MDFDALKSTYLYDLLSSTGKNIFLPPGIFYWSGRAKKEAKINATIGVAKGPESDIVDGAGDASVVYYSPSLVRYTTELGSQEVVAYAPILGIPDVREAWKQHILRKSGDDADRIGPCLTQPAFTSGITGSIYVASKLLLNQDEAVISPELMWGNYRNIIERNVGAKIETFPMFADGAFNVHGMERKLVATLHGQEKAVLILNFPNNPTGYMPDMRTANEIVEALRGAVDATQKRIVVICDDAYENYVYDDSGLQQSLFASMVDIDPRIFPIKLDGASKEFLFYGSRIGATTFGLPRKIAENADAVEQLENKVSCLVRSTMSNCSQASQRILQRAIDNIDTILAERAKVIDILRRRWHRLKTELDAIASDIIQPLPFNSGFFAFIDLHGISANALGEQLISKYATGVVPSETGKVNGIRVAFCSVEEKDIPQLVANVKSAVDDLLDKT